MVVFHLKHFRLKKVMKQMWFSSVSSISLKKHIKKHEPCQIHLTFEQSKFSAVNDTV